MLTSVAVFSSVEHPERPHEGGEDAGEGGGALHEDAHRGIVHLQENITVRGCITEEYNMISDPLSDGVSGGPDGEEVRLGHVAHLLHQLRRRRRVVRVLRQVTGHL